MEQQCLLTSQRPFSFLEHERLKKDQKEPKLYEQMLKHNKEEEERRKCPFKAKPVPCVVKEAALGEQQKEEELYRAIKMQMRARELLHSASMPPSMLAWQLSEKQVQKVAEDDEDTHQPKIYAELPDASYRKFWKLTRSFPPALSPRTLSSSLCSSLSGSQECLSAKITDAAKKHQEAMNAKRAEEKLYSATLHGCGLSESFIGSKAHKGLKHRQTPSPAHSGSQAPPTYSKNRNEDNGEFPDLQDSLLSDYADDYEEYDHDMEAGHMNRDDDRMTDTMNVVTLIKKRPMMKDTHIMTN
ncbi:hypothetical protein cypCar_00023963 [Cyprinus carpio]|nr:hypothetical protein cypCar_00023963 [Cyprinus carpio]